MVRSFIYIYIYIYIDRISDNGYKEKTFRPFKIFLYIYVYIYIYMCVCVCVCVCVRVRARAHVQSLYLLSFSLATIFLILLFLLSPFLSFSFLSSSIFIIRFQFKPFNVSPFLVWSKKFDILPTYCQNENAEILQSPLKTFLLVQCNKCLLFLFPPQTRTCILFFYYLIRSFYF